MCGRPGILADGWLKLFLFLYTSWTNVFASLVFQYSVYICFICLTLQFFNIKELHLFPHSSL